jgi:Zn-dependent protease with chaperone function
MVCAYTILIRTQLLLYLHRLSDPPITSRIFELRMTKLSLVITLVSFLIINPSLDAQQLEAYEPAPVITDLPDLDKQLRDRYNKELAELSAPSKDQLSFIKSRYKARHEFMVELMKEGDFIVRTQLNTYVEDIYKRLLNSNPDLDPDIIILISRSAIPNAFNTGDGFVVINVGLLARLEYEGQLAFVLGHEIGHQAQKHVNKRLMTQAEIHTDKDRKKQINEILKSEYRVRTQLENFLLPGLMNSMRHSRSAELEADSLGYAWLRSASYHPYDAISLLELLDISDKEKYQEPANLEKFFQLQNVPFKKAWLVDESVSSLGAFEQESHELEDSLKTHPDCQARIVYLINKFPEELIPDAEEDNVDAVFQKLQIMAECEVINGLIQLGNYGRAFHYALQLANEQPKLEYPIARMSYILAQLSTLKKARTSGKHLSTKDYSYTDEYNTTLGFLWELGIKDSARLSYYLLRERNHDFKETEVGFTALIYSAYAMENKDETKELISEYKTKYPKASNNSAISELHNNLK